MQRIRPGGRKFEPNAGGGLAGTCVMVDAAVAACGGLGQACCTATPACGIQGSCQAGSCRSCVADVTFGRHFGCVLSIDHSVWCAGENDHGELGFGLPGPSVFAWMQVRDATTSLPLGDVTAIALGDFHACAIRTAGAVWCWGQNTDGEVGNGATLPMPPMMLPPQPAAVPVVLTNGMPLVGAVAVAAGDQLSCATNGGGAVWCWGRNSEGQLGDGTNAMRSTAAPVLAAAPPSTTPFAGAMDLTIGAKHACARKASGEIWCWGSNFSGELGDGTTTPRSIPVKTGTAPSVSAGAYAHTCWANSDGTASCVGSPWRGRLGNATNNAEMPYAYPTPQQVITAKGGPPLTGVASVAVGGSSCALMLDGTVECWGDNIHGQTGTGIGANVPAHVVTADGKPLDGIDRVLAHYAHVCAHQATGELVCWGRGTDGELGDATPVQRAHPAPLGFSCP